MAENDGGDPWDFLGASKAKASGEPINSSADPTTESKAEEPSAKMSISDLMPARKAAAPSDSGSSDHDAWGFLAARKADVAAREDAGEVPVARVEKREAGEFRAEMGGVSLKRRAWPIALALALISLAGFLTETVAAGQVLSIAGPSALLWIYPLGGLGLMIVALLQFKYVDQKARLTVLRVVGLIYAAIFAVALALVHANVVPLIAVSVTWLLADQLNFLVPILLWSLAGDEFNVAEARRIFGWIVSCTYAGQVTGLVVATLSPTFFGGWGVELTWLLVVNPVVCIFVALWLPFRLKGTFAAQGTAKVESLKESLSSARDFINGVPVWRKLLLASIITFTAGSTCLIAFQAGAGEALGGDAARIQQFFGAAALVTFVVCWLLQYFFAERIMEKCGIPGTLMILPIATVIAGIALAFGVGFQSLPFLALGLVLWFVPRWSIDENARRAALALVPDERRTRVSFVVDLAPISIGLIVAGPAAVIGVLLGYYWLVPATAAVLAICALPLALSVRRGWDESLLNWRLRRRKQNRSLGLDEL